MIRTTALLAALLLVSPAEASWPQWRGPSRDGSVEGSPWPDSLASLELRWRLPLDKSYSGPIVSADRVFVTETARGETEVVRALDRRTGAEHWKASWPGDGSVPFFARKNGDWIRSTPAIDGEALYVGGMNEVLVSLDLETGRENWRVDFPSRFGTAIPDFGFASSPLVDGDAVYAQAANSVVKLDRRTGATIWRSLASEGDIFESGAFSSPVIASLRGERQLVVHTREALHGLAPSDGRVLWSRDVPHFRGMNILTPTIFGDRVLTSSYRNRTYLFEIDREGETLAPRVVWSYKSAAYMSSPVVVDGHAYLHLGSGRLTCIDLSTGTATWTTRPMGDYWSMVVRGDKILALSNEGILYLIRTDPSKFRLLDQRQISRQPTWAHLAVSAEGLFVRELEAVASFRWRPAE